MIFAYLFSDFHVRFSGFRLLVFRCSLTFSYFRLLRLCFQIFAYFFSDEAEAAEAEAEAADAETAGAEAEAAEAERRC